MKHLKLLFNKLIIPCMAFATTITVYSDICKFLLGDGKLDSIPDENTEENLLKILRTQK